MEGSPGVVCTSGVVCRDGGHLSALCRLVSLLHVDRGGVLQALCRHAGFESNPALQRHGPTKILATLFGGFESDLTGRGKVRKKTLQTFLAGVKSTLQVREPGPRGLCCSQCACMQGMPASLVGCSRPPCWPGFERRPPRVIKTRTRHGKDFSDPPMGFFSSFSGMFSLCPRACPRFLVVVAAARICASHTFSCKRHRPCLELSRLHAPIPLHTCRSLAQA